MLVVIETAEGWEIVNDWGSNVDAVKGDRELSIKVPFSTACYDSCFFNANWAHR